MAMGLGEDEDEDEIGWKGFGVKWEGSGRGWGVQRLSSEEEE